MSLNPVAQSGFANSTAYDAHRPTYPPESLAMLIDALGVAGASAARVLDLAAGTGKFTAQLAARPEGFEIMAVEPHAGMREVLEGKVLEGGVWKHVRVVEGRAEDMARVEGGWADAVVVAQAFHWFATTQALKEIHRVLKPGRVLGLVWNIEDYNSHTEVVPVTAWEKELKAIIWAHDDGSPRFRHGEWQKVFDGQLKSNPLTIQGTNPFFSLPLGKHVVKWEVWLSKDAIWDRFHTISYIANLHGEALEETKQKAYEAMSGDDVEKNEKGELKLHGQTLSFWTSAIPGHPPKSGE